MLVNSSFQHWIHHIHDSSIKVAHYADHTLHEKSFWSILAIVLLIMVLFTLVVLTGKNIAQEGHGILPYGGPYY